MQELIRYFSENAATLGRQTLEHLGLTALSVLLAVVTGVPLGVASVRYLRAGRLVLGVAGVLQTVPSIALLGFMIPLFGIGALPAVIALFLYALLPIIRNTATGIREVDPAVRESAWGMGLSGWQVLTQVELPLALPVLFAGIRTAAVINVGVATLAALIASGGLGESIFGGIALNNTAMILAGAIPAAGLAVVLDAGLARLQRLDVRRAKRAGGAAVVLAVLPAGWLLVAQSSFKAGFAPEFMVMSEGYPGLQRAYGLQLNTKVVQSGLMYDALHHRAVDVISGFSTDGRIRAYNLFTLADDRRHFPAYDCGMIVRQETLDRFPPLGPLLAKLSGKFTDAVMIELNYQVDVRKQSPAAVARAFLDSLGLWRPPVGKRTGRVRIGSKIFTEQYILAEMVAQLVEGHTSLAGEVRAGMGGTQICFQALRAGEIDLYPEYSGTGLEVILKRKELLRDSLGGDPARLYGYVSRAFPARFGIRWLPPLGFNNTYALLMRPESARERGIKTISDLQRVTAEQSRRPSGH
jgi:osmoprotectant transport system permease protein